MRDESYTIQQLATEARVSVRTVGNYVYQGLIPPPLGTRRFPIYTNAHLRALLTIRRRMEDNVRLSDFKDHKSHQAHIVKVSQR